MELYTTSRLTLIVKLNEIVLIKQKAKNYLTNETKRLQMYDTVKYDHFIRLFYTKNGLELSIAHYNQVLNRLESYYQNTLNRLNKLK
jgi:hypothetical protein